MLLLSTSIKRVVIETTGVCDVTLHLLRYTLIKFPIHRSIFPKRSGRSHWCLYRHQSYHNSQTVLVLTERAKVASKGAYDNVKGAHGGADNPPL